mmetsp:Transcript_64521/g.104380  ORF Transcript_64521/g.104380 Transcript_64521/m.104380 type:complete len:244 (+) Transcript_64521:83-814(+)
MQSMNGASVLRQLCLNNILEFCPDGAVLDLVRTSRATAREVVALCCIVTAPLVLSKEQGLVGIWRHLNLEGLAFCLRDMPTIVLCCDHQLRDAEEIKAFCQAAREGAAETEDGRVFFNNFTFRQADVRQLFSGLDNANNCWCRSGPPAQVSRGEFIIECCIEAPRFDDDGMPMLTLCSLSEDDNLKFETRCSSPAFPSLKLTCTNSSVDSDHELDDSSPLSRALHEGVALPIMLGIIRLLHVS